MTGDSEFSPGYNLYNSPYSPVSVMVKPFSGIKILSSLLSHRATGCGVGWEVKVGGRKEALFQLTSFLC